MAKYGDFFPENPQNLEELVDSLARRAAAAASADASRCRPSSGRSSPT